MQGQQLMHEIDQVENRSSIRCSKIIVLFKHTVPHYHVLHVRNLKLKLRLQLHASLI